ncbi:MAG: hypothetical protein WCF18_16305, partial [Chthoniobacteraceae bacterium]
ALKKQFYQSASEFVQAIFAEDATICEEVQSAITFAHGTGVLSDEEQRICAFHEAYATAMKPANAEEDEAIHTIRDLPPPVDRVCRGQVCVPVRKGAPHLLQP